MAYGRKEELRYLSKWCSANFVVSWIFSPNEKKKKKNSAL